MSGFKTLAASLALACVLSPDARAADDAAALRAELQQLKNDYGARIVALESRIAELESAGAAAAPAPVESPSTATAFNPSISLILGGNYAATSRNPESWRIAGFLPADGEIGPGERSFNLGESELTLAASVDPYFT